MSQLEQWIVSGHWNFTKANDFFLIESKQKYLFFKISNVKIGKFFIFIFLFFNFLFVQKVNRFLSLIPQMKGIFT